MSQKQEARGKILDTGCSRKRHQYSRLLTVDSRPDRSPDRSGTRQNGFVGLVAIRQYIVGSR